MNRGFKAKFFDPARAPGAKADARGRVTVTVDAGRGYVYGDDIVLAVNAALATQRALLVAGHPGTGKSTLAANVAAILKRKYYGSVVTSRTRARDLMWSFDALHRLADSQPGQPLPPRVRYIEPRVLWWAFDAKSAARRGATGTELRAIDRAIDPAQGSGTKTVVLLDEIDKAEPDVPNDLLEALELGRFKIEDLDGERIVQGRSEKLLVIITTNRERELPAAFVRRCVVLDLDRPETEWEDWLVTIGNQRYGVTRRAFHREIAQRVMKLRRNAAESGQRKPSTAEYLDALATCRRLGIGPKSLIWDRVAQALLTKGATGSTTDERA